MARFINLTPHDIKIVGANGVETVVPASGAIARVSTQERVVGSVDGIPLVKREFGEVEGLPAPADNTIYIVSSLVLSAIKGRGDVVAPDTGPTAIRDEQGRIQAVTRLIAAE